MLENISKRLDKLFKKIRGRGLLTEANIDETLREVRLALLEADVHFKVAKSFCDAVREKAVGKAVLESLTPGQQVVKIVSNELTELMGGESKGIAMSSKPPTVVMLVGLQGSGKTTTSGKIARYFQNKSKRVVLVAADLQRPAAVDQLETLAKTMELPVVLPEGETDPVSAAKKGVTYGRENGHDVVIIDTAGRLEIDDTLMEELARMKTAVSPDEMLLVADAMTGQTAVSVAETFHEKLGLSGVVLTKTEGDARGGAILSIRAVTGAPVRFIGTGEKLDALELFHPDRMASRILGMGDVLSLVELAEQNADQEEAALLEQKLKKDKFTLDDFSDQLSAMKKMGGAAKLMEMIPGMQRMKALPDQAKVEREMKSIQAMISSMTARERREPGIINGSRRKRISRGSGTSVPELNRLLKQFYQAKKMMKRMSSGKGGMMGMGRGMRPF